MVNPNTNLKVEAEEVPVAEEAPVKLEINDLTIKYGQHTALKGVNLEIREHEVFGIIGPANAGKTSFLKSINRMDTFDTNMSVEGQIKFNGLDIQDLKNIY
ncbi:MAG: ATP-binding cassette domain-containing protein, partial [Candidatus Thiodiazotropha taylori]|nr:ATP-binding cassette domain-containing protein [Candidatus Thiodiazotropha taylori]MCW4244681.1 ATP-binding cassette domain-containing protein [Candidatus Thiodiazotropha taylori]